jgi:hypothetical protein
MQPVIALKPIFCLREFSTRAGIAASAVAVSYDLQLQRGKKIKYKEAIGL